MDDDFKDDWCESNGADSMTLVNRDQYRAGIDKLWSALTDEDGNLDTRGQDVYTLAAEAIKERNDLRKENDRIRNHIDWFVERCSMYRDILAFITRLARGLLFPSGPNYSVTPRVRLNAICKLATDTLEGKYN